MDQILRSIRIPKGGDASLDSLSRETLFDTATELRDFLKKFDNDPDIKKEARNISTFLRHLTGFDMIRRIDYARTSN
jgi:hypothetical protein